MNFEDGNACSYEIVEYTRNERIASLPDGNIARWSVTGTDEQKFLFIPLGNDKLNIVCLADGRFWTVSGYALNASVERQLAIGGNPDNKFQRFQTVSHRGSPSVFNILEFTAGEWVSVSGGAFDNGNVIRWGGSPDDKERQFSFIKHSVDKPTLPVVKENFPDPPPLKKFSPPVVNSTEPVITSAEILPFYLINDHFNVNQRHIQFNSNPYYFLQKESYWQVPLDQPPYIEYNGVANNHKKTITIKKSLTRVEKEEIKKTLNNKVGVGLKLGLMGELFGIIKGSLEGSINFENSTGTERKRIQEISLTSEETSVIEISFSRGEKVAYTFWQLVERWSILDPKRPDSPIKSWTIPTNRIDVEVFPDGAIDSADEVELPDPLRYINGYIGWRQNWSLIVPGNFGGDDHTDLLFYDSTQGEGELYTTDGSGGLRLLKNLSEWRKSWSLIVPGNFGGDGHTDLLFYDSTQGEGELYTTDGSGGLRLLKNFSGWRKSWSLIVPGNFGGDGHTDLLFYDSTQGEGELYTTDGSGGLRLLKNFSGWRKSWSLIVPGNFGGDGHTDLLFYDSTQGEGELYTTDGSGGLRLLQNFSGWRKSWSLIVPGNFGGDGHTDLLFYDPIKGEGELYTTDGSGGLRLLKNFSGWRKSWSLIVPGNFGGDGHTDLLFYDPIKGQGEFYDTKVKLSRAVTDPAGLVG